MSSEPARPSALPAPAPEETPARGLLSRWADSRLGPVVCGILVVLLFTLWELVLEDAAEATLRLAGIDARMLERPLDILWGVVIAAMAFAIPLNWLMRRNEQLEHTRSILRSRERAFRAFAVAGSDWLWETDENLQITRLFGGNIERYPIDWQRLLGRPLIRMVSRRLHETTPERWAALEAELNARRPFRDVEYEARLADGRTLVLSSSGVPIYDEQGRFEGYRGTTRDVTEARRAERALRESEARFSDFAAAASDSFWETDADLRFTYVSGRFEQNVGLPAQDMIGKTREEVVGPEEIARSPGVWRRLRETLERHKPFRNFEYEADFGRPERRIGMISGVPVFDEDGRFKGYRGIAADITEQRKIERQMVRTLNRFRLVADNMPVLISHLDQDGRFLFVNSIAERWYDRPRHRIVGTTVEEILGPETYAAMRPVLDRVVAGEEVRIEQTVTHPDGQTRIVDCVWVPDQQATGDQHIFGLIIDVTEQRELETQLRQNQKMDALGKLTGGIAHDFNNLLLAIQGNVEFLRDEVRDPALRRFATNALSGVTRAADLTQRLLAFSRRQPLAPQAVDVRRLVRDMRQLLRGTIEETIEIAIETGDKPTIALIDPGQMENAILNLAINARDAMPDGGRLTIRVRHCDDQGANRADAGGGSVCVEVIDTGTGMPETVRASAFDPFFTTKEIGRGTGLGLSMVHGFVKQSGGTAEIESEPGHGTKVGLRLPAAPTGAGRGETAAETAAPERSGPNDRSETQARALAASAS